MDHGATVCKPQLALCKQCVLAEKCVAYIQHSVYDYPVKSKKLIKKNRWLYYVIAESKGEFLVRKRIGKDIWQNLHEFFLIEAEKELSIEELLALPAYREIAGKKALLVHVSEKHKQQLTHQTIHGSFIHIKLEKGITPQGYLGLKKDVLLQLAFPKFITAYFEERPGFFASKV